MSIIVDEKTREIIKPTFESADDFFEHFGVKGMKWGVRKARNSGPSGRDINAARRDLRFDAKNARGIIKEHKKAETSRERVAAQKRYKKEVLDRIKTKQFKDTFRTANTMTKGEMAAHVLIFGPLAGLTIPAARQQYSQRRKFGVGVEASVARDVLKEMRSP